MAPGYLSALCQPVSGVPGRRHLRSAGRGELDFPHVNLSTYGGRAFAYAGPGTRCLTISRTLIFPFKLSNVILRHSYFPHTSTFSALRFLIKTRYINSLLLLSTLQRIKSDFFSNDMIRGTDNLRRLSFLSNFRVNVFSLLSYYHAEQMAVSP